MNRKISILSVLFFFHASFSIASETSQEEKNLVDFRGQRVPASHVPHLEKWQVLKNGIWFTPEEIKKLDSGYAFLDGEWIVPEEAENVTKGLFKIEGQWIAEKEADQYHRHWSVPWKIPTAHFTLITNLPRQKAIEQTGLIEGVYDRLFVFLKQPLEGNPPIYVIVGEEAYKQYITANSGDHSSIWAGCLAEKDPKKPGVALWNDQFGSFYVSHATAHVYLDRASKGSPVPQWFVEGVASYVSRFHNETARQWSLDNLRLRGSMDAVKRFTDGFSLSIEDVDQAQKNLLQAGLLIAYCVDGGDPSARKAFENAALTLSGGSEKKIAKAVAAIVSQPKAVQKKLQNFANAGKGKN